MTPRFPNLDFKKIGKKLHLVRDAYQPIECMHRVLEGAVQWNGTIERVTPSICSSKN